MAQRTMKVDHSTADYVIWRNAVTNAELVRCHIGHLIPAGATECQIAVIRYGVTQIVQDKGAVAKNAPFTERLAKMKERVAAVESAEYRLGMRGGMVDGDVFAALVGLGQATDKPESRAKWRAAKKSERALIRRDPIVAKWIAENLVDDEDSDAADDAVKSIFA